jgi:hypothetical protein
MGARLSLALKLVAFAATAWYVYFLLQGTVPLGGPAREMTASEARLRVALNELAANVIEAAARMTALVAVGVGGATRFAKIFL